MLVSASVFSDEMEILPGANIKEVGTNNATISDGNGRFVLNVASPKSDLIISFVGYKSVIISADHIGSYIELPINAEVLEEVIVTGQQKPKTDNSLLWLGILGLGSIASYLIFRKKEKVPPTIKV